VPTSDRSAVVREAARVLLLDEDGRVLLIEGSDPAAPELGTWWITPGGGLEAGESAEAAAVREVWEETGLELFSVHGPVHRRSATFDFDGLRIEQREQYFTARVPHFTATGTALTDLERRATIGMRWWTLDDIRSSQERVFPENLADLVAAALAAGPLERAAPPFGYALHHVQLPMPVGGEDDCRHFYVDVLGMTEIPKPPELAARGGLWVRADALELHLGVEEDFRPQAEAHPGILVADLDGLAARLEGAGVTVRWDDAFPGMRRFSAHDNNGNRLEFLTPEA
jgi:8-oxo-dGTP pyrophosphatase MutT (NUDIX family)/catechol 2,3-dioxygenase-like lactoylglutathione lyase family enzyme